MYPDGLHTETHPYQTHMSVTSVVSYAGILKRAHMESYLTIFRSEDDTGAQTHDSP